MAIKVQGTTVIDDSRNITANVICGNFCGGSINISISPRTCNVGFVATASQTVCGDTFEIARLRSESSIAVCVCNMPAGKEILFDVATTSGGTYCFRDAANTSMSPVCVSVGANRATIVSIMRTPSFCGICCYIQVYSCVYNQYGIPTQGSGTFSRGTIFGATDNACGFKCFTCPGGVINNTFCCSADIDGIFSVMAAGCCTACTASYCRTGVTRFAGSMRNGIINFGDGRALFLFHPPSNSDQWNFVNNSVGGGGYAYFCNSCSCPVQVGCGWCHACAGTICGFICGCTAWCRGPIVGADISSKYLFQLQTATTSITPALVVWPLVCLGGGFNLTSGAIQTVTLPTGFCCCRVIYNLAKNTYSDYVSVIGLPPGNPPCYCFVTVKACKTGNSLCPLCFVTCCSCNYTISQWHSGGTTYCMCFNNFSEFWACGEKLLMTPSSSCEVSLVAFCDTGDNINCPWCMVQRCRLSAPCFQFGAPSQSPSGRWEMVSFQFFAPLGSGSGIYHHDTVSGYNCCCNLGWCCLQRVPTCPGGIEWSMDCDLCFTGCWSTCQNCGCNMGWCFDSTTCGWVMTQACIPSCAAFKWYDCVVTCIPGCGGTLCRVCGTNGRDTCICTTFPYIPDSHVSAGGAWTFFNFSQATNNCCTCKV